MVKVGLVVFYQCFGGVPAQRLAGVLRMTKRTKTRDQTPLVFNF